MSRRAVVIGAGIAGMLAAAALSTAVDHVIVLDRDELPAVPEHRRGVPQGRHAHLLMPGGLAAMEDLLPDVDMRGHLLASGARELSLSSGMLALTPAGWFRRWRRDEHLMMTCSRALLDWAVRTAVLRTPGIEVRRAHVTGLLGTDRRVRGVRISGVGQEPLDAELLRLVGADGAGGSGGGGFGASGGGGSGASGASGGGGSRASGGGGDDVLEGAGGGGALEADFVVDASGRGTRVVNWLNALGIHDIRERNIDSGLVNATRVYRTPAGAEEWPLTLVQPNPYTGRPGRSGMIVPIENGQWMVSLGGSRGGEPPKDEDAFLAYALALPSPLVGRLIADAEPVTGVFTSHSTSNSRRYLEKCRVWPERFVALGDAAATFNPLYGQGMSVAALGALALGRELGRDALAAPGLSRRVQRAASESVESAWTLAVSTDVLYPDVKGGRPTFGDRLAAAYSQRLTSAATGSYAAASALWDVTGMRSGPGRLMRPATVLAALAGSPLPPLSGPPLTSGERAFLGGLGERSGRQEASPASS
uniref:FAD-dependent oxidoreductase n=1 Tax=Streptomyces corallincola TaxID=2851888 RepID=UPI001FE9C6DB|nr:pyridine nucleotide-disulfide oxidoreductase [Streptomyces corallincola]